MYINAVHGGIHPRKTFGNHGPPSRRHTLLDIMRNTLWWLNFIGVIGIQETASQTPSDVQHSDGATPSKRKRLQWILLLRRGIVAVLVFYNPYPQFVYLLVNWHDFIESAFAIYYVAIAFGMVANFCILVLYRDEVRTLIDSIEVALNKSTITRIVIHSRIVFYIFVFRLSTQKSTRTDRNVSPT